MIEVLHDDILLNIFHHSLDTSPRFWVTLGHVCRSWRQIIFTSTLGLRLRLHCTHGTPVLKALDCWPPLPLVVNYGGFPILRLPSPEDEDNIMAALEQFHRVCFISLTISSSLVKKLSTISEPFSELEELLLLSPVNVLLTLPSAFWWGHRLRTLRSTRIAFPSLPQLLLPCQDLVDIQLHEIPGVGYFSPEAFADALCGMTQLQTLSLYFLSLPPRRSYLRLPPLPEDRVVLPALICLKYRGISKYLDSLVARIDAPRLEGIDVTFFNQPTLDSSQLGLFIDRIETQRSPRRADILSSRGTISITFTQPGTLTKLEVKISCKRLDWQLSSICQICDHFRLFISRIEDLGIDTTGSSSVPNDMDGGQWVRLILAFRSAKDFRLAGDLATDILCALRPADEEHKTVLPALRNLHVQEPMTMFGPFWNAVESLVTQRRLSSHPVKLYYSESRYTCQICCVGFRRWRDLIGHLKDKHPQENMCPHCGIFQWAQGANSSYLFRKHLESEHPEVALTNALILNPDLESFLPHSGTPAPPQPTYPIDDYAGGVPRGFDPVPFQPGTEYVNDHGAPLFPEAFPQAHAGAPNPAHFGFATPGRPDQEPPFLPPADRTDFATYTQQPGYSRHRIHPPPQFPVPPTFYTRALRTYPGDAPAPHVGQKKALLVGIDYSKHRDKRLRLKWGVYDAYKMARFLEGELGFNPNNILILTDKKRKKNLPTEKNIVAAMRWLVKGAQSGDSLFFYFSGHATQIEDKDDDEEDGFDECLCAMDYNDKKKPPTGIVVDDTINDIMVKPLPRGCRLTAVLDCSHSGTLLDLPYIYDSQGVLKRNRPDIVERKRCDADVISLSACKDNEVAWETRNGGALRNAFIDYMKRWGNGGTYLQVIQSVRAYMDDNRFEQQPQLSSSHWIDTDHRFIIAG